MRMMWLKKIAVKIENKQNSMFTYPVNKQEKYIKHFPEPRDEIERSYFQYCCQMKLYGAVLYVALNLASLPLTIALLLKYKGKFPKENSPAQCIFFQNGLPENIIPNSLRDRYPEILSVTGEDNCLTRSDMAFLKAIFKRYPFSWMFWLKTIIKISQYSAAIQQHSPAAIISCDEFSFTSSVVTKFCHSKGVKRINVMHGEKLYFMRDTFIKYDEFYVWSKEYVDLLTSLRADPQQFRAEAPSSLIIKADPDIKKTVDYTYYLEAEDENVLNIIKQKLKGLENKGYKISIRPHPRYSNMKLVNKVLRDFYIEETKTISIEQSILQTRNAIAAYSSTLNQAYHSGIQVVIDDVSRPWLYEMLKDLDYVMLKKNPLLLSEL